MSQPFLRGLRRYLPSPRRIEESLEGVTIPGAGRGSRQWVLSRALYRFACFEMGAVPRSRREQALVLRLRQWSPFQRTGEIAAWRGDDALVWAWDAERLEASLARHGLRRDQVEVIPETLLRPAHDSGLYLNACIDGFEGQFWRQGSLISSRWWADEPESEEWLRFQRDAGVLPESQSAGYLGPTVPEWRPQTWDGVDLVEAGRREGRSREAIAVSVAATLLALATSWYVVNMAKLQVGYAQRVEELKSLAPSVQPAQLARGDALEALARVNALKSLDVYPDQLSMLAIVSERLTPLNSTLKEWDYRSGTLRIVLTALGQLPTSDFVKAFTVPDVFESVKVVPSNDPGSLVITMEVAANARLFFADGQGRVEGK